MKRLSYLRLISILSISVLMIFAASQLSYANMSSQNLPERVRSAIDNQFDGNENFDISVSKKGSVTIQGEVNSLYDKYKVFEIVSHVTGVKEISDQLTVNTEMLPDDIIKQNIRYALDRVRAIRDPSRIKISVDNGIVMLSGKVSFYRERLLAQSVASWQKGVTGLVNNIKVLPVKQALSDSNLKDVLKGMIHDQFPYSKNVNISVNNGNVTLTGSVDDLWTKKHMARQFSSVIGIKHVINHLTIKPQY